MGKRKGQNPQPQVVNKEVEITIEVKEVEAIVDGVEMGLNIRKDPEVKKFNKIAVLGKGTKVIVVDPEKPIKNKDGEWYKIRIVDKDKKENGFAMKKFIKII